MLFLPLLLTLAFTSPTVVEVEVASTPEQLRTGLQGRLPLGENEGMLFVLGKPQQARFWMKDVTFAIDMVFLDAEGSVDHIEAEVPPCPELPCPVYRSKSRVSYVLELPAGWAHRHGLSEGDQVQVEPESGRVLVPHPGAKSPED